MAGPPQSRQGNYCDRVDNRRAARVGWGVRFPTEDMKKHSKCGLLTDSLFSLIFF